MTNKTKKIEPAISRHFSRMAMKSWAVRKKKILEKAELASLLKGRTPNSKLEIN